MPTRLSNYHVPALDEELEAQQIQFDDSVNPQGTIEFRDPRDLAGSLINISTELARTKDAF